ncbi:MAG: deoxyribodipyrimidine photo-lyase [Xanthomonadaceae bacterium]|nr:deoxyribodipyrimidine photo-lyase [Xanthomonadaceae bacterium]
MTEVFARLHRRFGIAAVHAHEETGTDWTFARDRRVRAWCWSHGIGCHEYPQFGVIRGLSDRDGWARRWEQFMAEPQSAVPEQLPFVVETERPADAFDGVNAFDASSAAMPDRQRGGIEAGEDTLASFLDTRGKAAAFAVLTQHDSCLVLTAHRIS